MRTPKNASRASSGTTTSPSAAGRGAGWRRRTRQRRRRSEGRRCHPARAGGCLRSARCPAARRTAPPSRRPGVRPAVGTGSRGAPADDGASGTGKPIFRPSPTTVRVASITEPGSCHQTAAATTTAAPKSASPIPSRRCSGSRSRAVADAGWRPRPHRGRCEPHRGDPVEERGEEGETGPGPLRTARGAGRRAPPACGSDDFFGRACASGWSPGIGCSELRPVLRLVVLVLLDVDVLLLRDPGGKTYGSPCHHPTQRSLRHTHHTSACRGRAGDRVPNRLPAVGNRADPATTARATTRATAAASRELLARLPPGSRPGRPAPLHPARRRSTPAGRRRTPVAQDDADRHGRRTARPVGCHGRARRPSRRQRWALVSASARAAARRSPGR